LRPPPPQQTAGAAYVLPRGGPTDNCEKKKKTVFLIFLVIVPLHCRKVEKWDAVFYHDTVHTCINNIVYTKKCNQELGLYKKEKIG
jgi:hypothetical protein